MCASARACVSVSLHVCVRATVCVNEHVEKAKPIVASDDGDNGVYVWAHAKGTKKETARQCTAHR